MTIKRRRYKLLGDFDKVGEFLDNQYTVESLNGHLLKPFWEYAHTHPAFQHNLTHRFGLWEDDGQLVGIACYEDGLGQCFLSVDEQYQTLLPDMLTYAEEELAVIKDGKASLEVWLTDKELDKKELLIKKGYKKVETELVKTFSYNQDFPEIPLPEGFTMISLEDENDIYQINRCLWKGFGHEGEPDDDLDCRLLMQSGPNFSKALTTVIKAPNGDYACFAGMWLNEENRYAYLEPLATVPEYRKMGLATIALVEGMKKTKKLGANYCFGGANEFYSTIGFDTIACRELWQKEWGIELI